VTTSASISPSTEFRRRAHAVARVVRFRRDLQRRWRHDAEGARPFRCRIQGVSLDVGRRSQAPGPSQILVFSVPLIDGTGLMLERHLLALRTRCGTAAASGSEPSASVESLAVTRFEARRQRLSRLRRSAVSMLAAGRRATDRHLLSLCRPGELQTGLFSRSGIDTFEHTHREADRLMRQLDAAVESERRALDVSIGRPVLEAVFVLK
jgi:hypothetical protein